MGFRAVAAMYAAGTAVFVIAALLILPLLGAKPDPASSAEILSIFHLKGSGADDKKPNGPSSPSRAGK